MYFITKLNYAKANWLIFFFEECWSLYNILFLIADKKLQLQQNTEVNEWKTVCGQKHQENTFSALSNSHYENITLVTKTVFELHK